MRHIKRVSAILAVAMTLSLLASCGQKADDGNGTQGTTEEVTAVVGGVVLTPSAGDSAATAEPETAPDLPSVDEPSAGNHTPAGETVITLWNTLSVEGDGAVANGSTVTITKAGIYLISGTANDGQIIVDTVDEEKVTLLFNGASLSCTHGPAIFVRSAPKKVVISTVAGSVNILSDGTGYVVPDNEQVDGEIYPNACVYACEDLELSGEGELHIKGNADKGINTKDDLKIKGGTVTITSAGVGIRANDSLEMSGGTVTIQSGGDGIKTANAETEGKGYLTVSGGSLYITSKGDGLSAATDLSVSGGSLVLTTTDTDGEVLKESAGNSTSSSGGGFGRPGGGMMEGNSNKSSISAKGLKAEGALTISGGRITIVSADDGIHSNTDVYVMDGTIHVRAADDGVHAEKELTIAGGVLTIAQSYEGLEALHITVMGGTNRITASDDGANATNGEGGGMGGGPGGMGGGPGGMGGGFPGGRPGGWGGNSGSSSSDPATTPLLKFAGGYTVFNAGGDGIDSNGNIDVTGGVIIVYGPTDNGNGPIDSGDGGYSVTISGGLLLAVGSSGMAETAENNGQAVLAASWRSGGLSAGATVGIVDKDGKVLAAFELPKAIQSIVFSCPELVSGQTYSVVGGGTFSGEAPDGVIDPAAYTGYESMGEIKAN